MIGCNMRPGILQCDGAFLSFSDHVLLLPQSREKAYIPIVLQDKGIHTVMGIFFVDGPISEGKRLKLQLIEKEYMISAKLWVGEGPYLERHFPFLRQDYGEDEVSNEGASTLDETLNLRFIRNPFRIGVLIGAGLCILVLVGSLFSIL